MNQNNQTLEQKAKNFKNSEKAQAWKTAVAAALGMTVGAGSVYAAEAILNDDQAPIPEPIEKDEDVTVVENQPEAAGKTEIHNHYHNAPAPNHDSHQEAHHASLPGYVITEHEILTDANGSQAEVAYGFTDDGHLCAIYDNDMDGIANLFYEDTNDSGLFDPSEGINLADNDLVVSMNHLPNDYSDFHAEGTVIEEYTVVVPVENTVLLEGQEVVDSETLADSNLPEYTNDTDLAQSDDMSGVSDVNEYMA